MERRTTAARRAGFTLIELLIVMAIISILMGLLLVGVQAARRSAKRAQVSIEIDQLSTNCSVFKKDFGFYPPCTFTAIPSKADPADTNYLVLRRMFPRMEIVTSAGVAVAEPVPSTTDLIFKNPTTGMGDPIQGGGTALNPNQAMVYLLGGPSGTGWHPGRPTAPTGTSKKGPYFDFQQNRLAGYTYSDAYGTPYAYISSPYPASITLGSVTIQTYKQGSKFVNADGVQIISAGANKAFFLSGNAWDPGTSPSYGDDGGDDQANFNNGAALGISIK